jgi:ornithine carbamoyltransferase
MKHFVNILDHSAEELTRLLNACAACKGRYRRGIQEASLAGRILMTFFEKPSTRTRVSLEAAAFSCGGHAITRELPAGSRLGEREPVKDLARVVSRYTHVIAARTFSHATVEEMRDYATVPVINALSDYSHPTQAMADMLTITEHLGGVEGKRIAFVGDGNNVARSLAAACGRLGASFTIASPGGFGLDESFCSRLEKECPGMDFAATGDPVKAVQNANIVYTDVWASMGQEGEATDRQQAFAGFQVNAELMAKADPTALIMHDMPAHRDEEITDEVIESERSIVFDQAENRMHLYRGLFGLLLEDAS